MNYQFNELIERKGTNSLKYDFAIERGKPEDVLPLWVADMDFRTPPAVTQALSKAVSHGIFGYSDSKQDYFDSLHQWFYDRFQWDTQEKWVIKTPGVVYAIATAIRAFTKEGDGVMIQQPVYYPFSQAILENNRKLVDNPLVLEHGMYHMDFQDFETKIVENNVKMFILCSPHNPVGRVWTKDELIQLGDICMKYNVLVVSDEIHCDFTYPGYQHHVFANLKTEYLNHSIVCTAPSKTFNLAGLQISNIFIANHNLKEKFIKAMKQSGYSQVNTLGIVACQAAYGYGGEWLEELKKYLAGNLDYVRNFLKEHLPEIKLMEPQGTYLVWLDFREMGMSEELLEDFVVNKAKLWLDRGTMFGTEGEGFQRVNIACPREVLQKAMIQLETAVREINK